MNEKITEIQNYFLAKIGAKDFDVTKVTSEDVTILIDDEYEFRFYIGTTYFCYNGVVKLTGYNNQIILDIHTKYQAKNELEQFNLLKQKLGL
jgi:hypothetical protein